MKTISPVFLLTIWQNLRFCARSEQQRKTQINIWEETEMAQFLEQEKELVGQNGNHTDVPALELKPAPAQRIVAAEIKMQPSLLKRVLRHRRLVLATTLVVLIATATAAWSYFGSYETTDDAQVDGHLHPV